MAKSFPKPTEDSGRATNHKIHLRKISDDQRQKENPLKSSQRYKFNKTKLYFYGYIHRWYNFFKSKSLFQNLRYL